MIEIINNIIKKDNKDVIFPNDSGGRNVSIIAGFGNDETIKFVEVTNDGKLKVDANVSIDNITIGDVNIRGWDSNNNIRNIGVIQNSDLTWSLKVRDVGLSFDSNNLLVAPFGFDGSNYKRISVDTNGNVNSNIVNSPNVYNNIKNNIINEVSFNTNDSYNTILTIDTRFFKTKTFIIKNTGSNSAIVRILGSVDSGIYDIVLANDVKIDSLNSYILKDDTALTGIIIEGKNFETGLSTTLIAKGYMINI